MWVSLDLRISSSILCLCNEFVGKQVWDIKKKLKCIIVISHIVLLKDFRIYNRSLTEDEIYNIYNQVTTTSLVAYSPTPFIYNYDFYND